MPAYLENRFTLTIEMDGREWLDPVETSYQKGGGAELTKGEER